MPRAPRPSAMGEQPRAVPHPRTAGRFPCPLGALTSNTSSAAHASATEVIFAPDLLYAASSRVALSPASDSTSSSYPRPIGRLTVAGVAATREGRRAAIPSATPIRVGYFSLQYRRLSARPRSDAGPVGSLAQPTAHRDGLRWLALGLVMAGPRGRRFGVGRGQGRGVSACRQPQAGSLHQVQRAGLFARVEQTGLS